MERRSGWTLAFRAFFAGLALVLAGLVPAVPVVAQAPDADEKPPRIALQPHRIVYEVQLGEPRGSGAIASARGLMALEFSGNPCAGYATEYRQVVDLLDADGASRRMDFRVNLFEAPDHRRFTFRMLSRMQGEVIRDADGEARRRPDGSISVAQKKPPGRSSDFDGDAMFPTAFTLAVIEAAGRGERRFQTRVFDGSEGGEKVFDVHATIGPPMAGAGEGRIEAVLRRPELTGLPHWPIAMAYFEDEPGDRVPSYILRAVVLANGVMGDLVFEFADFTLAARAVRYEALPVEPCAR